MKVAHIADVHIRNYKYKDVYQSVFSELYKSLRKKGVDVIVVAGDIAHNKTNISPEYVKMASDFFRELSSIAETIVIRGNHDMNLSNLNREDAISPIIENIDNDNLIYMKDSGEHVVDDLVFNHLAVTDDDWITTPTNKKKINIALYHGMIKGSTNSVGHVFQHGDTNIANFKNFDFVMLGDIHKTNQILDSEGKVRYCGSLIQQNFGEEEEKGYLLWDIKDKEDFDCELITLENPKPFRTVFLKNGKLPKNLGIKKGSRVRIKSEDSVAIDDLKSIVNKVKLLYEPESVKYEQSSMRSFRKIVGDGDEDENLNLRSVSTQEKLIKEYLANEDLSDDQMSEIFKINKDMNKRAEIDAKEVRNLDWKINKIEWSNLFNYGKNNKIDFKKLNGIIGIFGENFTGKSSAIEAIIYTIFNSTSKNIRKTVNIINQNKEKARCTVHIEMGNTKYKINRVSEKYKKKLNGVESIEASTEATFSYYDTKEKEWKSLNGDNRWETEDNIRSYFGTLDNFLLTNYAAQFGSLNFISERSTQRKKILAQFLDLDFFERKYRIATEDFSYYRSALKKEEDKDYSQYIDDAKKLIRNFGESIKKTRKDCKELRKELKQKETKLVSVREEVSKIPSEIKDLDKLERDLTEIKKKATKEELEQHTLKETLKQHKNKRDELQSDLSNLKINKESNEQLISNAEDISQQITQMEKRIQEQESLIEDYDRNKEYIKEAPCNNEYSDCQLVKNAHEAIEELGSRKALLDKKDALRAKLEGHKDNYDSMNIEKALENLERVERLEENLGKLDKSISDLKYNVLKKEQEVKNIKEKKEELEELIKKNKKNKILIVNKKRLEDSKEDLEDEIKNLKREIEKCDEEVLEYTKKHGYYENKLEDLKDKKEEHEQLEENYRNYKLYKKTMHNNGIPFDIIRSQLPVINEHIGRILTSFVEFEVFFVDEDDKLEIYLKHPKYEPRLIETCSGAEKTISAMAIRLALMAVTSLPKANLFILDEPATELDSDNMLAFQSTVLDTIKNYFDNVILVSHLSSLKDIADEIVEIDKKLGYAYINV